MHRSSQSNQTPLCSQCSEDPLEALWKCVDCKLNLCQKCQISHLKIPLLQGHRILPLTEDTEMVVDRLVFCTIHKDKPIELYCEPCNIAICMKCKATTHHAHISKTVEDALEKLVPEIEGSTQILDEHLEAIEKSLVDVEEKVVETKSVFDECRSEVDKVVDERVKEIRAAQNKLKDELNLTEKVELEKLGETRVSLLDRQKEGNNLKKVVRISLDRARHATLLSELLQGGISDKVQSITKRESRNPANIDIHKPVLNVHHKQWKELSTEGIVGSLALNISKLFVMGGNCITGKVGPRYWPMSFMEFFSKPLKKKIEIVIPQDAYNISVIKNQIWVSFFSNKINIYNVDGTFVKTLNEPDSHAVEESPSGDIFIACRDNGLKILATDSEKTVKFDDGDIVDVCVFEWNVFCLDRNKKCITELVQETGETSWQVARKIDVVNYDGLNCLDRLIVKKTPNCSEGKLQFFVGSRGARTIMEFNENGDLVKQYGGINEQGEAYLNLPNLCGLDHRSTILVADECNNKYKILDPENGHWTNTGFSGEGGVMDAKLDSAGSLWCLQNNGNRYIVVQYQHEQ